MPFCDLPHRNRPPRLLNLELSPATKKAISTRNADTSPLLKLPAEIRTLILGYAIGGNTIHVSHHQRVFRTRLCHIPGDYDGISCRYIMDSPMEVRDDARGPDHTRCLSHKSHTDSQISLNLLRSCRQLHHEACLLPFSRNRFVFDSRDTMHNVDILAQFFKRYINNTQARAFADVVFDGHLISPARSVETKAFSLMTGLKKKGWILYLDSQRGIAAEMWFVVAGPLAVEPKLLDHFAAVLLRYRANRSYAFVDLGELVAAWLRHQAFDKKMGEILERRRQAEIEKRFSWMTD